GKGGTGKTTIATSLAMLLYRAGEEVVYLDCDVEEPNGHIFLRPDILGREVVFMPVPVVDQDECISCRKCEEICQYNAIVCMGNKTLVFQELCHACGGCVLVCPEGAITETTREIGIVEDGHAGTLKFAHGKLKIGEALAPPLVRSVKKRALAEGITIMDAPPGTTCPVVETIKDANLVILVTEPTPFGLNDLKLAVDMAKQIGVKIAVLINRCDIGDNETVKYCKQKRIEVLAEIPNSREVAVAYSTGKLPIDAVPGYSDHLEPLVERLMGGKKCES
ncbi:MAG: ATP-binding protein, partial [Candidatus Coatesbacteria bacterium]|nr:ATP-binding protein [Candidatus Coatesbacteria bacterium]